MNDDAEILAYFLPAADEGDKAKCDRALMGDEIRDYLYDRDYGYRETMLILVEGLAAWAFDIEWAGSHERGWPRPMDRVEALHVAKACIEALIDDEERCREYELLSSKMH